MKKATNLALIAAISMAGTIDTLAAPQQFRHIGNTPTPVSNTNQKIIRLRDAVISGEYKDSLLKPRTVPQILEDTDVSPDIPTFNRLTAPWVFSEYRDLSKKPDFTKRHTLALTPEMWKSLAAGNDTITNDSIETVSEPAQLTILGNARPDWLANAYEAWDMQEDMMYSMMVDSPSRIEYAYWNLPVPPTLPEEETGFKGFLKRSFVPQVKVEDAVIPEQELDKKHWLHVVNGALQFSQAYVSENWYQGGNNHLALLINFLWDVQLNPVHHSNFLFQSTLSYKLGLNSTEEDKFHKYSISQDIFQYNLKMGYKATHNWYYSLTTQFKTQLLNNYPKNSESRTASFLTPADLNIGLGMTYSKHNKAKTIQFDASIAPLSYNLRTAIDPKVDHMLFNIPQTAKTSSEIGSNAEITFNWKICSSVSYKTRLFLFTDYKYGMGDWENTLNFQFNKFLSTQLYANLRYDSSSDRNVSPKWNRWMLKEILSVGLSYTFSTKN